MLVDIIIALSAAIAGFLIGRSYSGESKQAMQANEQRLAEAEQELAGYREKVTEHFQGTAQLVERMNENYREVYQHLAEGAQQLTDCETTLKAVYPPMIAEQSADALPVGVEASHEAQAEPATETSEKEADENDVRDQAASARQAGF